MSPTNSDLEHFFQTSLARLDETVRELSAELEALRESQVAPGDSFTNRLETARHTAGEVRNKVSELARELGREVPTWSNRTSLEAAVRALLEARVDHARLRERLERVADQLEAGQFVHKIRRTAETLNTARLIAAAELRQGAKSPHPAPLPTGSPGRGPWTLRP